MSDEEELVSEEEVSEEEEEDKPAPSSPTRKQAAPVEDAGPSEAELAMQKRRQAQISSAGLDEDATEMLQVNLKERQQMDQEIRELRKRSEQRKKEREEEERRNNERRNEEEARRKAEEEDRRRQKESSEDAKKAEREMKNAELQKLRNNTNKPNFIIAKKEGVVGSALETDGSMLGQKSKEQLEADKRHALQQRIPQLDISGYDTSKLADKAKELHNLIYRLESEKYDLEHRFKRQQYDMMELAEKARQMSKGGKGKKVQVSEETDKRQETFAGCPAKIEMYSKYERQKDKRHYGVRKDVFKGPTYGFPPPRIQPQRKLVWNEAGLPQYVDGEVEEGGQENHVDAAPGQEV